MKNSSRTTKNDHQTRLTNVPGELVSSEDSAKSELVFGPEVTHSWFASFSPDGAFHVIVHKDHTWLAAGDAVGAADL